MDSSEWEDIDDYDYVPANIYYVRGNQKNIVSGTSLKIIGSFNTVSLNLKPNKPRRQKAPQVNRKERANSDGPSSSCNANGSSARTQQSSHVNAEPTFDPLTFVEHPGAPPELQFFAFMMQQQQRWRRARAVAVHEEINSD